MKAMRVEQGFVFVSTPNINVEFVGPIPERMARQMARLEKGKTAFVSKFAKRSRRTVKQ